MVSHFNNHASDHSDVAIECAVQGATGHLLVRVLGGSNTAIRTSRQTPRRFLIAQNNTWKARGRIGLPE